MAATYSRCFHALKKTQGFMLASEPRNQFTYQLRSYVSATGKLSSDILQSKSSEFSGKKVESFENPEVQTILKRLTGFNLDKVFKPRKESLQNPVYKVMDKKELEQAEQEIEEEARKRLEMPPVMTRRTPIKVVLSEDSELIDHNEDRADYVFTDISASKDYRTCAILVRENTTGILREASWDERDRMQFIYWPKEGQRHEIVEMLQDEHLPTAFSNLRHIDVLDFVNIQCEPDSPDYIRVHQRVYDDVDTCEAYNVLHSTRHFAAFVHHVVTQNKANRFLSYLMRNSRFDEAIDVVNLDLLLHPESEFAKEASHLFHDALLKHYIKFHGLHNLLEYIDGEDAKVSEA